MWLPFRHSATFPDNAIFHGIFRFIASVNVMQKKVHRLMPQILVTEKRDVISPERVGIVLRCMLLTTLFFVSHVHGNQTAGFPTANDVRVLDVNGYSYAANSIILNNIHYNEMFLQIPSKITTAL